MEERHLGLIAAGVAFYAMLAVFPGLAALIALWGFFADPAMIDDYLGLLREFIPADAYHLIEGELARLLSANSGGLKWTTFLSLGIGLWSSWSAVNALIDAMNAVHARRYRPGIRRYTYALILTFGLIALLLSALAMMVLVPTALAFIPAAAKYPWLVKALPTGVMVLAVVAFLGIFYRLGPNQDERPPWITPGAILAAILWAIASIAFSFYLANFASYNRI
jgi:membrane protein